MYFTVIIPCFNSCGTIARALDSLLAQTHTNFDVVIIDDASSDYPHLLNVVDYYKQKLSIKVLRNDLNRNGAFSRNRGIDAAQGEYLSFLDADDSWPSDRLESAANLITEIKTNQFIMYGKFELIQYQRTGALIPIRAIRANELVSEYVFAAGQLMQTSTFVCPREVARALRFDDTLTRHQDSDFMMRAQHQGIELVFSPKKCANYFFTPVDTLERIRSGRISKEYCENWLKNKHVFFSKKATAGYNLTVTARILYLTGKKKESIQLACKSLIKMSIQPILEMMLIKMYIFLKSRFGK